jgi:16S rRNA (cytosine1402-N4)-methyltransferase
LDANVVYHVPVLLGECIAALNIRPDGVYLDATAGGGGHLSAIAAHLDNKGIAIGVDRDPDAIAFIRAHLPTTKATIILEQCAFSRFGEVLQRHGIGSLDGLLLDLGVSSRQIDNQERGFSYMKSSGLDMRMDPTSGESAAEFCARCDDDDLAHVLRTNGEITNPFRMARAIKACETGGALHTSSDLVACLRGEYGPSFPVKVIARVFQALRIAVNDELTELSTCLSAALSKVKRGGRIVVVSYHSLEDRIVKNFFRDAEQGCVCPPVLPRCVCGKKILLKRINRKVVIPGETEIRNNSRARSARLRAAEVVA